MHKPALLASFLLLLSPTVAWGQPSPLPRLAAEQVDPSVRLEWLGPGERSSFLPGDRVPAQVHVTDPDRIVRRVTFHLQDAKGSSLNAQQEARQRRDDWELGISLPVSLEPGTYTLEVEAFGEGNTLLQRGRRAVSVTPAKFALKVLSPLSGTAFHRNQAFDFTASLDDPRQKVRRMFVTFEDPSHLHSLNGDREAQKVGDIWRLPLQVPATAAPGVYTVRVLVTGEGRQVLAEQATQVSVGLPPVRSGGVQLSAERVNAGERITVTTRVDDSRNVVRRVLVTCTSSDGAVVLSEAPAAQQGSSQDWTLAIPVSEDGPGGIWKVEVKSLGQGNEVLSVSRGEFFVWAARR